VRYRNALVKSSPATRYHGVYGLRHCRFFGLSDGWWLRPQTKDDTEMARPGLSRELAHIVPLRRRAA
jgi:hypothetical protein